MPLSIHLFSIYIVQTWLDSCRRYMRTITLNYLDIIKWEDQRRAQSTTGSQLAKDVS